MRLPRSQALSLDLAMATRLRSLSSASSTREGWKSAGPRRHARHSLPERDGRASPPDPRAPSRKSSVARSGATGPWRGGDCGLLGSEVTGASCPNTRRRLIYLLRDFSCCAGFSDAGMTEPATRATAGVGEAPMHEVAGSWALGRDGRYGDLSATLALMVGIRPSRMVTRARYRHA